MSADKPYYYWDPIGNDPDDPGKPEYIQLRARSYHGGEMLTPFDEDGLGDAAWRLGIYVATNPKDELAMVSLFYLLDNRLRYFGPQPLNDQGKPYLKHPRRHFTRDPIIMGLFGLLIAQRYDLIQELRFPWFISLWHHLTPTLWAWIKFLKTKKEKYARLFHLCVYVAYYFGNMGKGTPQFVRSLTSFMLFICPNRDCSNAVMKKVPHENLLLHFLNDYDIPYLLMSKPDQWTSRKGWIWNSDFTKLPPPIPEDEFIFLDKEILITISELWKERKLQENPMNLLSILLNKGSGKSIRN